MLDWSWITDSLLSNLYAVRAFSVHLSVSHRRVRTVVTTVYYVSLQTVERVWQNRSMWAQSEVGIVDALGSSFAKSLLSCMHSRWCHWRRGKLYVCIALSCFDCIMNKLNKLIKWEKQKWGDDGKGWGTGLTCTFYSKFLLWKIYYIFAWQLQLRASRDVLVAAYVRRARQWNRLSRSCRHFGLTARTEL